MVRTQLLFVFMYIYNVVYLLSSIECVQLLKFDRIPQGAPLAGLACAIMKCGTGPVRGVKFDTVTRECEPLLSSWFSNAIIENNKIYYILRMLENPFDQTKQLVTNLPPNFVYDSTLKFYIKTGDITYTGVTMIEIGKAQADPFGFCFYSDLRQSVPMYVFRSYPGYEGPSVYKKDINPMNETQTTYTFKLQVTASLFEVYVDDAFITVYDHQTDFFSCDRIKYYSVFHFFQRLQILYPNYSQIDLYAV